MVQRPRQFVAFRSYSGRALRSARVEPVWRRGHSQVLWRIRVAVTYRARRLTAAHASPRHLAEVLYRIRGLRMIGHVLHVGAHPDDEDAGLMAFVARKYGARMVYWSATRGEAGQNRIGSHSGDALGIYRTWESLAARAIDGGESWYGPFLSLIHISEPTRLLSISYA